MRRKAMRVPVSYRRTESVSIGGKVLVQDRYASGYLDASGTFRLTSYCMCRRLAPLAGPDVSQANRTEKHMITDAA